MSDQGSPKMPGRSETSTGWWDRHKAAVLETFVLSNFAFLILDVYLAHLVNRFRRPAEWMPVGFSLAAVLLLAPALGFRVRGRGLGFACHAGLGVGYASVLIGLAGVLCHLDSQFFSQRTMRSLVYTAPCAYTGLGFLLLMNRMVPSSDAAWGQWVVFFALGGFVGNFGLSLADHAMNGFFHPTEWLPVFASALAVGFVGVALVEHRVAFLRVTLVVVMLQAVVGVAGFYWDAVADINGLSSSVFENFVHGAAVFALLLCANIALLAVIGLWDIRNQPAPA